MMQLKNLIFVAILLPFVQGNDRTICAVKVHFEGSFKGEEVVVTPKDRLRNCGKYPCAKLKISVNDDAEKASMIVDIRGCFHETKCQTEVVKLNGTVSSLTSNFGDQLDFLKDGNNNQFSKISNLKGSAEYKCCTDSFCNIAGITKYSIGSIITFIFISIFLTRGVNF